MLQHLKDTIAGAGSPSIIIFINNSLFMRGPNLDDGVTNHNVRHGNMESIDDLMGYKPKFGK